MPSMQSVLNKYKLPLLLLLLLWRSNIRIFHFASEIFGSLGIILSDAKILSIKNKPRTAATGGRDPREVSFSLIVTNIATLTS